MSIYKIGIIIILPLLLACNKVDKVYDDREKILDLFKDIDVLSRGSLFEMNIYADSIKYSYFFEKIKNTSKYRLTDTLKENSPYSKDELLQKFQSILNEMNNYGIKGISSEFSKFGVTLKIYLKEREVLYVDNVSNIKNKEWLDYIKSSNKLDENWYWRKLQPSQ